MNTLIERSKEQRNQSVRDSQALAFVTPITHCALDPFGCIFLRLRTLFVSLTMFERGQSGMLIKRPQDSLRYPHSHAKDVIKGGKIFPRDSSSERVAGDVLLAQDCHCPEVIFQVMISVRKPP